MLDHQKRGGAREDHQSEQLFGTFLSHADLLRVGSRFKQKKLNTSGENLKAAATFCTDESVLC
jgi:hypothetical protein